MNNFVHLNLRTEYSIVDSILQIPALCETARSHGAFALAMTDLANLFGMVKFYKAAMKNGIKPIIGIQLWVEHDSAQFAYHKLVLLCKNEMGYKNLTQLISLCYKEGEREQVVLAKKAWVIQYAEGLIALSGAQYGEVGKLLPISFNMAKQALLEWMRIFPDSFYIELQRNQRPNEKQYEQEVLALALALDCPIVATNEVLFLHPTDFEAHKTRVCIQSGITLEQYSQHHCADYTEAQYLKTPEQMLQLFHDLPGAIQNTVEIAKRCSFTLSLYNPILPSFPVPQGFTEETYLEKIATEGLQERINEKKVDSVKARTLLEKEYACYQTRLKNELAVINSMGFPGYFLIVWDFIRWAKQNQISVGPGRGSGAGSLVAYVLFITDLDPIEYDLLFERFLNSERISLPDFDVDFCMDKRDQVIDYVLHRYGVQNVSQIATFGTMAAKAVIRDVGRVLGHPYGFVDKIAKLVPFEIGMTLEKALLQDPILQKRYQQEEEVRNLIDLAKKLEGITRNVGKHAGGVVIAPSQLTNYAPIYCEKNSHQVVIQFDKDDVESIGLIKFDFLGLRTLTIIDWAIHNVNQLLEKKGCTPIDIRKIALTDKSTFQLLKKCQTTAVFQLESRGMKELIQRLEPDHFDEIIALVALFRPGPLQSGMVDDFINRKHGRAKVAYPHPAIEPILRPTYGVILYQEQVMQIAQTLAGYTLGEADLLRRAMGKKKPEEMAKQRTVFTQGAVQNGVEEKVATYIFDLMEKFAGYGFNKSHSAAYAMLSYQTAWLKAHYPSAFMAAVLSSDMAHTNKVVNFIEECKLCNLVVIPPCIEQSEYFFTVNDKNEIVYGLGAIKGVGESALNYILEERKKTPFKSFFDLCKRTVHRSVNRRVLESLIKAGVFDVFKEERANMLGQLEAVLKQVEQISKDRIHHQCDLFSQFQEEMVSFSPSASLPAWTVKEKLKGEKETLGMYISGHPLSIIEEELALMGIEKCAQLSSHKKDQKIKIAGIVAGIKALQTKTGDRMALLRLDEREKKLEITVFPELYQRARELLVEDQVVILECSVNYDNFYSQMRLRALSIYTMDGAREWLAKKLSLSFNALQMKGRDGVDQLRSLLQAQEKGSCPVVVSYSKARARVILSLGSQWNIKPTQALLKTINDFFGFEAACLEYH